MPNTKYRRGKAYGADMNLYMRQIEPREDCQYTRLKRNLVRCIREEVTPRQREVLVMYYVQGMNQKQIAAVLGLDRSTVSRTIKRGEYRLQHCLRYGAERYLRGIDEQTTEGRTMKKGNASSTIKREAKE